MSFVRFQTYRVIVSGGAMAIALACFAALAHGDTATTPVADVVKMKRSTKAYSQPRLGWKYDRGTVLRDSRFQVLERTRAKGCKGEWLRIHPHSWICSTDTAPTTEKPGGRVLPELKDNRILPFRYVVTKDAPAYKTLDDAVAGKIDQTLAGVGGYIYGGTRRRGGKRFHRTTKGWVAAEHARLVSAPTFKGIVLSPADRGKRQGFVRVPFAPLYDRTGKRIRGAHLRRLTHVELAAPIEVGRHTLYPIKTRPEQLVMANDVGLIDIQPPPGEVSGDERWLDINMAEQTLVAYQGKHPVLATLVSTARTVTPKGVFRVERKRAFAIMKSKKHYSIHWDVHTPWVISIKGRIAMHGVYWHSDFGTARSHGCVNLSPIDAKWVWDWTEPALPPGWSRIKSTKGAPGSVVRIRRKKAT